jgi:hypothetical protein
MLPHVGSKAQVVASMLGACRARYSEEIRDGVKRLEARVGIERKPLMRNQ